MTQPACVMPPVPAAVAPIVVLTEDDWIAAHVAAMPTPSRDVAARLADLLGLAGLDGTGLGRAS